MILYLLLGALGVANDVPDLFTLLCIIGWFAKLTRGELF
jgi:hypothetical protein